MDPFLLKQLTDKTHQFLRLLIFSAADTDRHNARNKVQCIAHPVIMNADLKAQMLPVFWIC